VNFWTDRKVLVKGGAGVSRIISSRLTELAWLMVERIHSLRQAFPDLFATSGAPPTADRPAG